MNVTHFTTSNDRKQQDTYAVSGIPGDTKKNRKIAILTTDNTEDLELFYPYYRFTEAGYTVDVVTPRGGKVTAKHGIGLSLTKAVTGVQPSDYELLYIPGGKAPAELRKNEEVLNFVKKFAQSGKTIAALCHGPQVLLSAGLIKGKKIAAWPEIASEIQEGGSTYVSEALTVDGQFITGRKPGDLPQYMHGIMQHLQNASVQAQRTGRASA